MHKDTTDIQTDISENIIDSKHVKSAEKFSKKLLDVAKKSMPVKENPWYFLDEKSKPNFLIINSSNQYVKDLSLTLPISQFKVHINIEGHCYDSQIDKIFNIIMPEFFKYSWAPNRAEKDIIFPQMKFINENKYEIQKSKIDFFRDYLQFFKLLILKNFDEAICLCDEKKLLQFPAYREIIKLIIAQISLLKSTKSAKEQEGIALNIKEFTEFQQRFLQFHIREHERMLDGTQITIYLVTDIMEMPAKQKAFKNFIYTIVEAFAKNKILMGTAPLSDIVLATNCPVSLRNTGKIYIDGATDNYELLESLKKEAIESPLYAELSENKPILILQNTLKDYRTSLDKDTGKATINQIASLLTLLDSKVDLPLIKLMKFQNLYTSMPPTLFTKEKSTPSKWLMLSEIFHDSLESSREENTTCVIERVLEEALSTPLIKELDTLTHEISYMLADEEPVVILLPPCTIL